MSYSKSFRQLIQSISHYGSAAPTSLTLRSRRSGRKARFLEALETRQLLSGTAPVITDVNYNTFQPDLEHGTTADLTAAEFESVYTDPNSVPLASITVDTLPSHGTLKLNNVAVTAEEIIQASDLDSLTYASDPTYQNVGGNPDSFSWQASNGTDLSNTANFDFTVSENSNISITGFTKDIVPSTNAAATTLTFTAADFSNHFTASAPDSLQSITINFTNTTGQIRLNGALITSNESIPVADIGELTYTPKVGVHTSDSFTWTASDGINTSSGNATVSINIGSLSIAGTTISGNVTTLTNTIPSGDANPLLTDFTNFGFNSTASTRPTVSRTYTITNNSANTVTLAGAKAGAAIITVSGGNAGDFVVSAPLATTLAAGASTTFTITFKPSGAGLRKTTVSVNSTIPGESPYTFLVEGTGVAVTTKTGDLQGLQVGTAVKGTGTAVAVTDDLLTLDFSGTLLDGTPINPADINSTNGSATGFNLILGNPALAGITAGLAGIKVNETRVLIIPAALAFGLNDPNGPATDGGPDTNGTLDVPAGATVIYSFTAKAIVAPKLVVTGGPNSVPIAFGDKTTLLADATDLGGLNAPGSLTSTFHLSDGAAGQLATSTPAVTISGTNAASFTVTQQPTVGLGQLTADFIITYTALPGDKEGIKTATITIHTNDPLHPSYTFNVSATFVTNVDLVPTIKTGTTFPATTIISGSGKGVTLPVVITNNGSHPVPTGLTTEIQVWAQPTSGSPILVQTYEKESVAGLAAGGNKTINLSVVPPLGFTGADGNYTLFAVINTNDSIPETNTNNDTTADSTASVHIGVGTIDIQGKLVSTTLLPQVANRGTDTGSVVLSLNNVGNLNLPSNQQVTVAIGLKNASSGIVTPIKTFTQSVGGLVGNGAAKNFTFNVTIPATATINDGTYDVVATITPVAALSTDDPTNNTLLTTATGGSLQVTVAENFSNIGGVLGASTLPIAGGVVGQPTSGKVAVTIRNTGNLKFSPSQKFTVQLTARNASVNSGAGTAISGITTVSTANWNPNQSSTVTLSVTPSLVAALAQGDYDIVAVITPVGSFPQTHLGDEDVSVTAANLPIDFQVNVATDDIDLSTFTAPTSVTNNHLPTKAVSGSFGIHLINTGNVPLPQGEIVTVTVSAVDLLNPENTKVIGTLVESVSLWKVGQNASFSKTLTIPANFLVPSTYQIQAVAVTSDSTGTNVLSESLANNTVIGPNMVVG